MALAGLTFPPPPKPEIEMWQAVDPPVTVLPDGFVMLSYRLRGWHDAADPDDVSGWMVLARDVIGDALNAGLAARHGSFMDKAVRTDDGWRLLRLSYEPFVDYTRN